MSRTSRDGASFRSHGWIEGIVAALLTFATIRFYSLYEMLRGMEKIGVEGVFVALVVGLVVAAIRRAGSIERAVAERDKAMEAFRGSQDLYRHIVESAHEMIFEVDMEGRITFVNKAGEHFMEYPASEILGRRYLEFVLDSHKDSVHRFFVLQAARNISVQYMEGPTRTKSGREIWFGQHVHLKREGGKVIGFQVISRDVTERRAVEMELRKRERTIRAIFNQAPIGIALTDATGRFLDVNDVYAEMMGYTRAEILERKIMEITTIDDMIPTVGNFNEMLEGRSNGYKLEKRYRRKDGAEFWGRLTVSRLFGENGDPSFAIGMVENIDEWKRTEEDNRRLTSIVEETTDIVATADVSGRLLYMNKAGRELLGIRPDEDIAGLSPREFYSPETAMELKSVVRNTVTTQGRWNGTLHLHSRSGKTIPVSQVIIGHTREKGLEYFSTIARDITKDEEAKSALDRERTLLRTLIEAIPDEIAIKDRDRRFILANSAAVRALKKNTVDDVLGKRDEDLVDPMFAEVAKDQEERVLNHGEVIINNHAKSKIDPVTGTILRGMLVTKVPLRNDQGEIMNVVVVNRDVTELKRAEAEKERIIQELKDALTEVRTLSGLLPICAHCKKIRDDGGYWNRIESYIESHTSAQFSHGLCPDCMGEYFPGVPRVRPESLKVKEPRS